MKKENKILILKEKKKKYWKEYSQRLEVITKRKKYREENKEKINKQKRINYQKPEAKLKKKEYGQRSEVKERRKGIYKRYHQKPEVKERMKKYMKIWRKKKNNKCSDCKKHILNNSKRCQDCARLSENNVNWLGGTSFLPYSKEFNRAFKREIRKRDNYTCLKCGRPEHEEKEEHNKVLSIHHINSQKDLTIKENCCALCQRCNNEVNYKRKYYQQFFQSILADKYGYKYEDRNIILKVIN